MIFLSENDWGGEISSPLPVDSHSAVMEADHVPSTVGTLHQAASDEVRLEERWASCVQNPKLSTYLPGPTNELGAEVRRGEQVQQLSTSNPWFVRQSCSKWQAVYFLSATQTFSQSDRQLCLFAVLLPGIFPSSRLQTVCAALLFLEVSCRAAVETILSSRSFFLQGWKVSPLSNPTVQSFSVALPTAPSSSSPVSACIKGFK